MHNKLRSVDHSKWRIEEDENGTLYICMENHPAHQPCNTLKFIKPADEWGESSYFLVWGRIVNALNAADPDWNTDTKLSPIDAACKWIARMVEENEDLRPTAGLRFDKLRAINSERCLRWHKGGIEEWSVADWGVALAGEAGEVCNAIKKLRRIETGAENKSGIKTTKQAIAAIGTELADVVLYADLLAQRIGISLEESVVQKFNAVSVKYKFPERL